RCCGRIRRLPTSRCMLAMTRKSSACRWRQIKASDSLDRGEPFREIPEESIRVRLELQRMMRLRIFEDLFLRTGKRLHVGGSPCIVDDAITPGEHQQTRNAHVLRHKTQIKVQAHALDQEPRCRLM